MPCKFYDGFAHFQVDNYVLLSVPAMELSVHQLNCVPRYHWLHLGIVVKG